MEFHNMASNKTVVFSGVNAIALSKHLRANGVKVPTKSEGSLTVRSPKSNADIIALAQQLPGCVAQVQ
jgi:hypothetical protein